MFIICQHIAIVVNISREIEKKAKRDTNSLLKVANKNEEWQKKRKEKLMFRMETNDSLKGGRKREINIQ